MKLIRRLLGMVKTPEKSAEAMHYPEKIIIATRYRVGDFIWYSTDILTILPADVDDRFWVKLYCSISINPWKVSPMWKKEIR